MKKKILFTISTFLFVVAVHSQRKSCLDSSYRIKYVFGSEGANLYDNPDTSGLNFFTGSFLEGSNKGLALLRTNWGDSIIWAKKIFLNCSFMQSLKAPNGTIICTGSWNGSISNKPEMLICRIDTNSNVLWIKRYKLSQNHNYYQGGSRKNILITNNSIYVTAVMYFTPTNPNSYYNIIAKLDLDGNIIWSKSIKSTLAISGIVGMPVFYNNSIIVLENSQNQQTPGPASERYPVLTRLSEIDGSIIESNAYKTVTDNLIKGTFSFLIKNNPDTSLSLTGLIDIELFPGSGQYVTSNIIFNTKLDATLNPSYNFYYRNNIPFNGFATLFDFNNLNQHAFLSEKSGYNFDKYFVTFGKKFEIQRSRKFVIASSISSQNNISINLDDKQNLHFLYHYPQSSKTVTEYARISNLAPNGTLGCFGKDTAILSQYPFNITKQPFTWDNIQSDVIVSNDVPYTEDTAIVTKELVCKIVSYCDSIHIQGPATACLNQPVRYTVNKNNGCFKNSDWAIDTSFATIINTEGDSTINISFKKPFAGYILAALTDCVVKDSFFVKTVPPKKIKFITRDSLLCPGKSITLKADSLYRQYQWQDGSTADSLLVTAPGFYKLTATDFCGFKTADSIVVNNIDTSLTITATQTICRYDTAFINLPGDVNITWQPTGNAVLNNKTLLLYPMQTTLYQITGERLVNCPITKPTEVVIQNCVQEVYFPTAFTPNNDNHNDIYKVFTFYPLRVYQLVIYNRYGQKIFETNNPNGGWDGTYKGSRQPMGGYTYQCSYQFTGRQPQLTAGYFILIR